MGKNGFKELKVWQRAKDLAVRLYQLSQTGDLARDFGLRDQLRRSAVSVASNIAEGDERDTNKEAVRFFYIAKGSLAELLTSRLFRLQLRLVSTTGPVERPLGLSSKQRPW